MTCPTGRPPAPEKTIRPCPLSTHLPTCGNSISVLYPFRHRLCHELRSHGLRNHSPDSRETREWYDLSSRLYSPSKRGVGIRRGGSWSIWEGSKWQAEEIGSPATRIPAVDGGIPGGGSVLIATTFLWWGTVFMVINTTREFFNNCFSE